jgi:hypothetical protein
MDSPMDELIQLFQENGVSGHRHAIEGVKFMSFNALEDIRQLLQSNLLEPDDSTAPQVSKLRPEAKPFVPSGFLQHGDGEASGEPTTLDQTTETDDLKESDLAHDADDQEEFQYEHGEAHIADTTALVRSAVLERAQRPPSEVELRAASLIQRAYKRVVRHRRGKSREALSVARAVHFTTCWRQAQEMLWPYRYYRLLFLGPLPHVLLCLDSVYTYASSTKAKMKKRLQVAKHEELEDLSIRQTEAK